MDADQLDRKAHEYELSRAAAEERGDQKAADAFAIVELVLRELADLDREAA